MRRVKMGAVGLVAAAMVVAPAAGVAKAPAGALSMTGAYAYNHAEDNPAGGDCSDQLIGTTNTIQYDYGEWSIVLVAPNTTALANADLSTTGSVLITVTRRFSGNSDPLYWGAGNSKLFGSAPGGASGRVTTSKGDLSGTVTATLKAMPKFPDGGPAKGTLHIKASWRCSKPFRS